jgi:pimeloyl-ACP methyl ester carboxylesterase
MSVRRGIAKVGNFEIAYQDWGDKTRTPMILIMGLSGQLTVWPDGFCEQLVAKGHRVIRFDNRDIGLSSKSTQTTPRPGRKRLLLRSMLGLATVTPYSLADMAGDVIGLMDALGVEKADIVGASMGGMIAQIVAASHPARVSSLGVIMSSTNQAFAKLPEPSALRAMSKMLSWPIKDGSAEGYLRDTIAFMQSIKSPGFPIADETIDKNIRLMFARSPNDPLAVRRQSMATFGAGDLRRYARAVTAPTVVIHGADDPLIRLSSGRAVAKAIKGSRLEIMPGMGHDLPEPLWGAVTDHLHANAAQAA